MLKIDRCKELLAKAAAEAQRLYAAAAQARTAGDPSYAAELEADAADANDAVTLYTDLLGRYEAETA